MVIVHETVSKKHGIHAGDKNMYGANVSMRAVFRLLVHLRTIILRSTEGPASGSAALALMVAQIQGLSSLIDHS
jgi:hypothetical protein